MSQFAKRLLWEQQLSLDSALKAAVSFRSLSDKSVLQLLYVFITLMHIHLA